jgi:hypothetical protein
MAANPERRVAHEACPCATAGVLGGAAALLYVISFFLPALGDKGGGILGFQAFIYSVLLVVTIPMWLANPLFWLGLALLMRRQWHGARFYGLLAVVLGLSESWMYGKELAVGYILWVGSMVLLTVAGWCGCRRSLRKAD